MTVHNGCTCPEHQLAIYPLKLGETDCKRRITYQIKIGHLYKVLESKLVMQDDISDAAWHKEIDQAVLGMCREIIENGSIYKR